MGIREDIQIERAHQIGRTGVVIVKLLSYKQKSLILATSRKLKNSELFSDVYVREDFSATVRLKRRALIAKAKELNSTGKKSKLRFDKLVTDSGVYTYSLERCEVIEISRCEENTAVFEEEEGAVGGQSASQADDWNQAHSTDTDRRDGQDDQDNDAFDFLQPDTVDRSGEGELTAAIKPVSTEANVNRDNVTDLSLPAPADWLSRDTPLSATGRLRSAVARGAPRRDSQLCAAERARSPHNLRQRQTRLTADPNQLRLNSALGLQHAAHRPNTRIPQPRKESTQNRNENRNPNTNNTGRGKGRGEGDDKVK
jgi:hypothetical protein